MIRKALCILLATAFLSVFASCDFSKKIKDNQKEIAFLKENSRILTEAVNNYERTVKRLVKDVDYLKRKVAGSKTTSRRK